MSDKNKDSWNNGAATYSEFYHSEKILGRILENPANAFHHTTWEVISKYMPDLRAKKICVPSSGVLSKRPFARTSELKIQGKRKGKEYTYFPFFSVLTLGRIIRFPVPAKLAFRVARRACRSGSAIFVKYFLLIYKLH